MKIPQFTTGKILGIVFCYFFVVSCNKSDITPDKTIVTDEKPMLLMASTAALTPLKLDKETYNGTFKRYTYDATGRCIRIDMNDSYNTYRYSGNTVIETTVYTDPTKANIVRTYTLNSIGLAATCTYTTGTKTHLLEYVYNSNRQVTKRTHKSKLNTSSVYSTDDTIIYAYNADGNNTTYTYKLSLVRVTDNYIYDKTRFNTRGNEFKGLDWLGKSSKNVLSFSFAVTEVFYPTYSNSIAERINYNWTYDAQGYNKQYTTSGASSSIATFTYK